MKSFLVEKSIDGKEFQELAIIPAAGNHRKFEEYSADDQQPNKGINYYRIRQITNENKAVHLDTLVSATWVDINEAFSISEGEKVLVVIKDAQGNEVFSKVLVQSFTQDSIVAIDPLNIIIPGKYIIISSSKDEINNKQLVVNQK